MNSLFRYGEGRVRAPVVLSVQRVVILCFCSVGLGPHLPFRIIDILLGSLHLVF